MLLEVLSTPLMTWLARSVYSDTAADPAVLLDGRFAERREIEAHLLDGFIPAAFAGPVPIGPRRRRPSPRAQDAERWLSFLACHLDRLGTRDLEWWRLQNAVPPPVRWLAPGLVAGLWPHDTPDHARGAGMAGKGSCRCLRCCGLDARPRAYHRQSTGCEPRPPPVASASRLRRSATQAPQPSPQDSSLVSPRT